MKLTIAQIKNKLVNIDFSNSPPPLINKGLRGQWIQNTLGIPNSSDLLDLEDGELKVFQMGESIAITQLKHCLNEIIYDEVDFENSKVGNKLKQVILICFSRDNQFIKYIHLNSENYPIEYQKIETDYSYISKEIKSSFINSYTLNTITGPNKFLQIRTKDSKTKGQYHPLIFENKLLKDKNMAFYLCPNFTRELLEKKLF